jgi:hypothetical protein
VLFLFFCCWVVLYGSVQSVQQGEGTIFEAVLWHENRGSFFGVFLLLLGRTVQAVQHSVGHVFLGTYFEEVVQLYGFGHVFQGKNFVGQICCCEVFFLAGNCEYVAVMYFPEAINKISLSLSRWVSPHWGFPWHLPKFLSFSWVIECCPLCLFPLHICLAMCISAYGNF